MRAASMPTRRASRAASTIPIRNPSAIRTPYVCSAKPWMLSRTWCMGASASQKPYREKDERDRNDLRGGERAPDAAIVVAHELDRKAQQAVERDEPGEDLAVRTLARPQVEI